MLGDLAIEDRASIDQDIIDLILAEPLGHQTRVGRAGAVELLQPGIAVDLASIVDEHLEPGGVVNQETPQRIVVEDASPFRVQSLGLLERGE